MLVVVSLAAAAFPAVAAARAARGPILPPANPRYSLAVGRYIPPSCSGIHDFSGACQRQSLGMINAGRRSESLGPLLLPSNWRSLTVAQQLLVLTDLERTARGLAADTGLTAALSTAAVAGADAGRDPSGRGSGFAALWAGGEPNSIVVMADWIYEDGLFASGVAENLNCSVSAPAGCWQHRDILLHDGGAGSCGTRCAVGAGYSPSGYRRATGTRADSYAEVFARSESDAETTFTWASELDRLPACERAADTCSWAGSPVTTTSGIVMVGGSRGTAKPTTRSPSKPWFALNVSGRMGGRGAITLKIRVGITLFGVRAVARLRSRHRSLRVRRTARHSYTATGRLSPGVWTVTIVYRARAHGRQPISRMRITVPRTL